MSDHSIDELHDLSDSQIRRLPDRSSLSKLYFSTNKGYQKGSVNFESSSNKSSHTEYVAAINHYFWQIGLLIPIPFGAALFFYNLLTQNVEASSAAFVLPLVAIAGMSLVGTAYLIYKQIKELLDKLGIITPYFLIYVLVCLSLIYGPIWYTCLGISNSPISQLVAYVLISIISSVISWLALKSFGDEEIGRRSRILMIFGPVIVCLAAEIIFSAII